ALNMMDVADRHGMHIDPHRLGDRLGCPVVPLIASRGEGVGILQDVVARALEPAREKRRGPKLDNVLETTLATLAQELAEQGVVRHVRFVAAALLEGDTAVAERV